VHGIMAGRGLWRENLDALRRVATPVVVELYGHGRSPAPAEAEAYAPASYLAVFDGIRRDLGAERWFLAGHSLGAALTISYALAFPERVIAHVFTNSASALAGPGWHAAIRQTIEQEASAIEEGGPPVLADHRLNPAGSRHLVPAVRAELRADTPLLDPGGVANTMRHTSLSCSVRDTVVTNAVPALLLVGEREKGFAEPSRHAEATMPLLEVVRLDVGHSPNAEAPADWNGAVAEFLAGRD
jgi:2-succinyl-6-hydroxy-2,4-cyclohexadiene-1-carboxylate synthase